MYDFILNTKKMLDIHLLNVEAISDNLCFRVLANYYFLIFIFLFKIPANFIAERNILIKDNIKICYSMTFPSDWSFELWFDI